MHPFQKCIFLWSSLLFPACGTALPNPLVPVQEHTAEPVTRVRAKLGWASQGTSSRDVFLISIPKTVQWGHPWLQGNLQKELQRTSGGWEKKKITLRIYSSSYGGTESPNLKGEMQVTGMADHSPTQQLLPSGTQCSRCGTNPSFTQALQNVHVPQMCFFLKRLHQVKGLAESKGGVLPATMHPQEQST